MARPENPVLLDNGCKYSPSCYSCILPECRLDMTPGITSAVFNLIMITSLYAREFKKKEIATLLGVNPKTVQRARKYSQATTVAVLPDNVLWETLTNYLNRKDCEPAAWYHIPIPHQTNSNFE